MSQFPLIKKYLPKLEIDYSFENVTTGKISPANLEAELAKGSVTYGLAKPLAVSFDQFGRDTHQGLLIGYQPINGHPVSKSEIKDFIAYWNPAHTGPIDLDGAVELLKRIEKAGICD